MTVNAHVWTTMLVTGVLSVGCPKHADEATTAPLPNKIGSEATTAPSPPKLAVPASLLTSDKLLAARGIAHPSQPWVEAQAKLEASLGKPTAITDGKHAWAVIEGDSCTYLVVQRLPDNGGEVGSVQQPTKTHPEYNDLLGQMRECREWAARTSR